MPGALGALRVLDLSRFISGPYCAQLLGDLGADVVKVERPNGGDDSRSLAPLMADESLYFMVFNRNKRGITLDFRKPEAQEQLRQLAGGADVLIENFRPGVMGRMGCDWETLSRINPRLIMVSITGFGSDGPLANQPCFDVIAQAMSGLMWIIGQAEAPPTMVGTFVVDYCTALYAAIGLLAAVEARHRTGKGQHVEVNLLDSAMSLLITGIPENLLTGREFMRHGNRDLFTAPTQCFEAKDKAWVQLCAGGDPHFPRLAESMGKPELVTDPRFATLKDRMDNVDALERIVAGWFAETTADDAIAALAKAEVPAAGVATIGQAVRNPQVVARKQIVDVAHARAGTVPLQAPVIRMSDTPPSIRRAAPMLGEHNDEILDAWLSAGNAASASQ